jgi:hypothetical protein
MLVYQRVNLPASWVANGIPQALETQVRAIGRHLRSSSTPGTSRYRGANWIWLVVWNKTFIFHFIYGIILPIDFHIFQDGYCTTNQDLFGNLQGDTLYISTKSAQKRHLEMGPLLPPRTSQDLDGKFKHALGRTPRTPRTPRGS